MSKEGGQRTLEFIGTTILVLNTSTYLCLGPSGSLGYQEDFVCLGKMSSREYYRFKF